MPLQTQTLELNFKKGLQTATDPKLQLDGDLMNLENAEFDKIGRIVKRNGYMPLSNVFNGGSVSQGAALATISDNGSEELNVFDGRYMYGYSEAINSWIRKGKCNALKPTNHVIVQNTNQQTSPDVAYAAGVECHVREDSRGGIFYSIIDSETRTIIVPDTQLTGSGEKPRVINFQNTFICLFADTSNRIRYSSVSALSPSSGLSLPITLVSDLNSPFNTYDACIVGSYLNVAYQTISNAQVCLKVYDVNFNLIQTTTKPGIEAHNCITVVPDAQQNTWCIAADDGYGVSYFVQSYNGTSLLGVTTIEALTNVYRVTALVTDQTATVFYEVNAANTYDQVIRSNICSLTGGVGTPGVFKRSVGLAAKCFTNNGTTYIPVAHESLLQSTFFVLDSDGDVACEILPGQGGGLAEKKHLPTLPQKSPGVFIFPNTVKTSIISEAGDFFSELGINATELNFNSNTPFANALLNQNLIIAGGITYAFDGARVFENNFFFYPENVTYTQSNTVGGSIADGYYQYSFVFEEVDNRGNIHRSPVSVPITVQVTGSNNTVSFTVPTLRVTARKSVKIDCYRTEESGTVFYKVTSTVLPVFNDPSSDNITIVDSLSDSIITSQQTLYTTGEIENAAPGSANLICNWKDRLWQAGKEDPNTLAFTKKATPGSPPDFVADYTIKMSPEGGVIMDIKAMGDLLYIFKERAIFALGGEGPNNAGAQSDYGNPALVENDVGCSVSNCLIEIPDGLMFVSQKGIQLLPRGGGQCQYIGANVENFNGLTFLASLRLPGKNQVVFITAEGTWLIYDYFKQVWGTWKTLIARDAVVWKDTIVYVKSTGFVYQQTDSYDDAGSPIRLLVGTSWIQPAGQQGYIQLGGITVLGDYKDDHDLVVEVYRDYSNTRRTFTVDVSQTIDERPFGSQSYGSGVYGGITVRYQYYFKINQKCEAFRVVIYDQSQSGESMSLSGLRFTVAGLPDANRLPVKNKSA